MLRAARPRPVAIAVRIAAALAVAVAGCASRARNTPAAAPVLSYAETRPMMSTVVGVTIAGASPAEASAAADAVFAIFARVEEEMNEWRGSSPLSALNAAAGTGRWLDLPADLCEVLRLGRNGAETTGGLFDPTWAALRGLWRFGEEERPAVPSPESVEALCPLVGWRGLELGDAGEAGACRARLARPGMQVGLGGLAKGWAVDRAVAALRGRGLRDFVVQAGGDLYAGGTRAGRPWTVGIRDPRRGPGEAFAWLEVSDHAFSTSGDSERFFLVDGVRYHHVLDPRTCRPAAASRSASVLAPTAVAAEILGKAVFVLGGEAGLRLAEREGAEAVLVTADGRVLASPALRARLRVDRDPLP